MLMVFLDKYLGGDEFSLFFYGPSVNRITKESEIAVKIDIRTKVKSKISRLDINRAALRKLEASKTDLWKHLQLRPRFDGHYLSLEAVSRAKAEKLQIEFSVGSITEIHESLLQQIYGTISPAFHFVALVLCRQGWDNLVLTLAYYMQQKQLLPLLSMSDLWEAYDGITALKQQQTSSLSLLDIPADLLDRISNSHG